MRTQKSKKIRQLGTVRTGYWLENWEEDLRHKAYQDKSGKSKGRED